MHGRMSHMLLSAAAHLAFTVAAFAQTGEDVTKPDTRSGPAADLPGTTVRVFQPPAPPLNPPNDPLSALPFDDGPWMWIEPVRALLNSSGSFATLLEDGYGVSVGAFVPFGPAVRTSSNELRQFGALGDFNFGSFAGQNGVNLNQPGGGNFRLERADLYVVGLGPALQWVIRTSNDDGVRAYTLGAAAQAQVGGLSADIVGHTFNPLDRQILVPRGPSDSGFVWGGQAKVWSGIAWANGVSLNLTGSYGAFESDAVLNRASSLTYFTVGAALVIELDDLTR